jgi:LPXTG-motif cell wall-anchored protein
MPRRSIDTRLRALAALLVALVAYAPAPGAFAAAGRSATADQPAAAGRPATADQPAATGSQSAATAEPSVAVPADGSHVATADPPPDEGRVVGTTAYAPRPATPSVRQPPPSVTGSAPRAHAAGAASVAIRDFSFGPSAITVHVGDTVTWTNAGPTDHTATGTGFDTGTLSRGQSGSHAFTSAGTFAYHCTLHPFMRGTVTVVAAAATGGGGASSPPSAGTGTPGTSTPTPAPQSPAAATSRPTLPNTGTDALGLALAGISLLLAGLLLRARTRPR